MSVPSVTTAGQNSYVDALNAAWQAHLAPRDASAPTVVSTFAGCGGSSLGYSMAGYREILAVEWDDNAVATFKLNFPDVSVYHGDIRKLSVDDVLTMGEMAPGDLDVLDGSPPCQGFSTAGSRVLDDPRNMLFREFVRLLRGLRPKVFVMENVSGMIKGKMKLVFAEVLRELKASDYRVSVRLMNAMYFQVPQSRERLIFVGVRNDLGIEPSHPRATSVPLSLSDALMDLADAKQMAQPPTPLRVRRWQETRRGHSHHERFSLNRLAWNRPAPTVLRTSGSGGHMHPDEPRLLNVGELCRIASFPDSFVFAGEWLLAVERIGNSVPPFFMREIAKHLRSSVFNTELVVETRAS